MDSKFTDIIKFKRQCITTSALIKTSMDVITELLKVGMSSNDEAFIDHLHGDVIDFENRIYNKIFAYEHNEKVSANDHLGDR